MEIVTADKNALTLDFCRPDGRQNLNSLPFTFCKQETAKFVAFFLDLVIISLRLSLKLKATCISIAKFSSPTLSQ